MARFVPDIKTQRWIIISPVRWSRPADAEENKGEKPHGCPFCYGNEHETPSEIMRVGEGEKDKPGWKVRIIPNKFPITDIHEVIIHSPEHDKDINDFGLPHLAMLLDVFRQRFIAHINDGQVMIFTNHGEPAGASLTHPHSQLVVIPKQINLDALVREPVLNIVEDNTEFITYCPDFSQWPYEVWVAPKKENTTFADITDIEIKDLAGIFQKTARRLKKKYEDLESHNVHTIVPFAFNCYIHHSKNWFIRIIPRLVHRAGFELGTGLSVNIVDPSDAAEELKKIDV